MARSYDTHTRPKGAPPTSQINSSTLVNALTAIGVFEPIERSLVRWAGFSLRSWASTQREDLPYIPTLLLTSIGSRSGAMRSNALFFLRDGGDFIVVDSKAGSPTHPAWFGNLQANARRGWTSTASASPCAPR